MKECKSHTFEKSMMIDDCRVYGMVVVESWRESFGCGKRSRERSRVVVVGVGIRAEESRRGGPFKLERGTGE